MVTKDFTRERKSLEFRIDDDVFRARSPIPAQVLLDFAKKFSNMSPDSSMDDQLAAFTAVLDLVLMPESREIFFRRMSDSDNPIEVGQVEEIITWLFEEYGLRPTELPSPSAAGSASQGDGTSLTGSTPAVVSIS